MRIFGLILPSLLIITGLFGQETVMRINTIDSIEIEGNLVHFSNDKLVLFIAGSGPTDRNCNNSMGLTNNAFKMMADTLRAEGISSFRYDKRGIAESTKVHESELTIYDYVYDASFLVSKFAEDYDEIYIFGHSEGALIGKVVAHQNDKVSGFMSVCGMSVTLDKIILEQLAKFPKLYDLAEVHLNEILNDEPLSEVNPMLQSLFRESVVPYLKSVFELDPIEEIKKVETPILIIGGGCDRQVSIAHAKALQEANSSASLAIINNMGHVLKNLQDDCSDDMASYSDPVMPLHPDLVATVLEFVNEKN